MKKGGNAIKPGSLSQTLNKYEKDRMDYIARNKKKLDELNLQNIKKSLMVTSEWKGKKNKRVRHDDEYNPIDDIETGLNNSSDDHVGYNSDGDSESSGSQLRKVASMPFKRRSTRLQTNFEPMEPHNEVTQSQLEAPHHEIVSNLPITTSTGASTIRNTTKKVVRGPTRGLRTEKIIARTGMKLPVQVSDDSNVLVGDNASSLINELGKEVRRNAPIQGVSTWTDIDESLRKAIIQRALDKFEIKDFDDNGDRILNIIENICQSRYRSWKCRLHEKYEKMLMKGVDPKSKPPTGVKLEDWNYMIEHVWTVEKWMDRSRKAKVARACLPYNHSCGSRSFPATVAIMTKENNNKKPDIVDLFEKTHWSKSKGDWVHPTCKEKHDKFVQVRDRCSAPDATPMTDKEMSIEVLGSKPGYFRGLGFGPKHSSTQSRAQGEEVKKLKEVIESQNRQIEAQNKFMEDQRKLMEITMNALQQAGIVPPIENSSGGNIEGTS